MELLVLGAFAFAAGLVDAVVGGGGLIQLPALMLFLPAGETGVPAAVLGTNKLSSICGTGWAMVQYLRRVAIPWGLLWPGVIAALAGSWVGARLATGLDPAVLKPLMVFLLVVVAVYTFVRKDLGVRHAPRLRPGTSRVLAFFVGAGIGLYDGFFGPGTGSLLIFVFVGAFGFDFLTASASAKLFNFATNLTAVWAFAAGDQILYRYAVPMALCNILGSLVGTRLAILKGNRWIRAFFLVVVTALILRLGADLWRPLYR